MKKLKISKYPIKIEEQQSLSPEVCIDLTKLLSDSQLNTKAPNISTTINAGKFNISKPEPANFTQQSNQPERDSTISAQQQTANCTFNGIPINLKLNQQSLPPNVSIYMNIAIYVNTQQNQENSGNFNVNVHTQPMFNVHSPGNSNTASDNDINNRDHQSINTDKPDSDWIISKKHNNAEKDRDDHGLQPNIPYNANYLQKRVEPKRKCKCIKKRTFEEQQKYYRLLSKKITKARNFWNKSSFSYPFCFRKRVMNVYVDTDETSVNEILDFSKKMLNADESDDQSMFENNQ